MNIFLIDDHGEKGEYAHFLQAYQGTSLPAFSLTVFSYWSAMLTAFSMETPDLILIDMRFDETPAHLLCGDIQALAGTDRFCGDLARAEAQIRGSQGVIIARELRAQHIDIPAVLFATLPAPHKKRLIEQCPNLRIIDGLILNEIQDAFKWAESFRKN